MNDSPLRLPGRHSATDTVILADGDYPSAEIALALLTSAGHVICCDGAAGTYIERTGRIPDAVVGDGDSITPAHRKALGERFRRDPDQNTNDLTKAFRHCMAAGLTDITILGATGKREDHTLANIALLADYSLEAQTEMVTDHGVFNAVRGKVTLESVPGGQVSLFAISPDTRLSAEGLLYPLPADGLRSWWQGSLNEAEGDRFTLCTDGPVIVFRTFDIKRIYPEK